MDPRRSERVAAAIREELQEILNFELDDPRIGAVSVVEVALSGDGRRAVARILPEDEARSGQDAVAALDRARGRVRRLVAERLDLYRSPEIVFEAAAGAVSRARIKHLARRIRKGRPADSS